MNIKNLVNYYIGYKNIELNTDVKLVWFRRTRRYYGDGFEIMTSYNGKLQKFDMPTWFLLHLRGLYV